MKLHALGTTGYHPNNRRHTACYMLPSEGIVLDAGTAAFRVEPRIETERIDLLLSHAHLDHVAGLTYLLGVAAIRPDVKFVVHGEAAKLQAVREHLFSQYLFPVEPPIDWAPLAGDRFTLASGAEVSTFPLTHPGGSIGYRFDWPDRSLAYVTDVAAARCDYLDAIRGVDLLLHEAYFRDEQADLALKTGHSTASEAARAAQGAGAGRLVLIHLDPSSEADDPVGLAAAQAIFPAASIPEDGDVIEF